MSIEQSAILAVAAMLGIGSVAVAASARRSPIGGSLADLVWRLVAPIEGALRIVLGRHGRLDDLAAGRRVVPLDYRGTGSRATQDWHELSQPVTSEPVRASGISPTLRAELGSLDGFPFQPHDSARAVWRNAAMVAFLIVAVLGAGRLLGSGPHTPLGQTDGGLLKAAPEVLRNISANGGFVFPPLVEPAPSSPPGGTPSGGNDPGRGAPGVAPGSISQEPGNTPGNTMYPGATPTPTPSYPPGATPTPPVPTDYPTPTPPIPTDYPTPTPPIPTDYPTPTPPFATPTPIPTPDPTPIPTPDPTPIPTPDPPTPVPAVTVPIDTTPPIPSLPIDPSPTPL